MGRVLQSAAPVAALALSLLVVVSGGLLESSPRSDHPAVRYSALMVVVFWGTASALIFRGYLARVEWVCAWLMLVAHVAAAFHFAHGWSHEDAYRHTAATAGVGEGLYVNYLFVAVWGADAVWLAISPRSYAARPRWVGWAVHGFLGFIVLNATVVFGSTAARVVGIVVALGLAAAAFLIPSAPSPAREPRRGPS